MWSTKKFRIAIRILLLEKKAMFKILLVDFAILWTIWALLNFVLSFEGYGEASPQDCISPNMAKIDISPWRYAILQLLEFAKKKRFRAEAKSLLIS